MNNKISDEQVNKYDNNSKNYLYENIFKEKYQILETIGEGGYGKVYKSKTNSNEFRAIKEIDLEKYKQLKEENYSTNIEEDINKLKTYINNEINNMKKCSYGDTNIYSVHLYDYLCNDKKIYIIMDLCDDNLSSLLKKKKSGFSVEEISDIIHQLNHTFKIMNKFNIIHRDLKLENILVKYLNEEKTKYIVKLGDYGISREFDNQKTNRFTIVGTLYTEAPEIMKNEKYNDKCDLWSLGVIIYMLFFKKPPFLGQNEIALLNNIKIGLKKPLKTTNNELLDDLLSKLLKADPKKRISWKQYFNHPFCKTGDIKIDINSIDKKSNNYLDENLFKEKYQIL